MPDELREQLQRSLGPTLTIERELGGGGMSRVFVARDVALARPVVVKLLPPDMAAGFSVERFRREIQVVSRLQHAHIVPLLNAGETGGVPYYTMPLVEGESLRTRISRVGALPLSDAITMLRDVSSALAYAHARGIVHRDIKPENILLTEHDAVVTDFGVAKAVVTARTETVPAPTEATAAALTSLGVALGTPAYMAPEQVAADPSIDHRADLYALGCVAYEMLAGVHPYAGRSPQGVLAAHLTETPERIDQRRAGLPTPIANLVMQLLAKRPDDRPASAVEVIQVLDGAAPGVATSAAQSQKPPTSRRARLAALVALTLLVAAGATFWQRSRGTRPVAVASNDAVAVMPFENASGDTAMAFFADGMADELTSALQRAGVSVRARSSAFALRGRPPQDVGRALSVGSVLQGKVRRAGSTLRVDVYLVDVTNGNERWTHSYNGPLSDVFDIQDSIATVVVEQLSGALLAGIQSTTKDFAPRGTSDLSAYDLYLRGRRETALLGVDHSRKAIEYYRAAVTRDGAFARGHAALAIAFAGLPMLDTSVAMDSVFSVARAHARRALELDSTLSEAHLALGSAALSELRFGEAEQAFQRALALNATSIDARVSASFLYYLVGRLEDGLAATRRAAELDPLNVAAATGVQYGLYLLNRRAEALAETRHALTLDSVAIGVWQNRGLIELFGGSPDSAVAALTKAVQLQPSFPFNRSLLLQAYRAAGRDADARRERAVFDRLQRGVRSRMEQVIVHLAFGEVDAAMLVLEQAFEARESTLAAWSISCDPLFDPLKTLPRFEALARKAGIALCPPSGRASDKSGG